MNIKRLCLLSALLLLSVAAQAGRGIDLARGQAIWNAAVNGRSTTIGTVNGPLKITSPTGVSSAAAGGATKVSGSGTVPVDGKQVPVGFTGEVAKEAIVGGVVGCATGGIAGCVLGTVTPLAIAYLSLSGGRLNPETGQPEFADTTLCTIGPCYWWNFGQTPNVKYRSQEDVCRGYAAWANTQGTDVYVAHAGPAENLCYVLAKRANGSVFLDGNYGVGIVKLTTTRPPDSPTWNPATPQEVRDALYKNNPTPGIVDELSKHGNIIWPLGNVNVTGPSEVKGPKRTSITQSGNRSDTTVSQDSTPLSYSGPTVTAGNTTRTSTTTSTTTNSDGTTSTSTSTTTETTEQGTEGTPQEEPEEAPTDTALPAVPTLYTRKYPQGLVGIWNEKKSELNQSQLFTLPGQLLPTGVGGGSCPTWTIPLDMAGFHDWGMADLSVPCWVYDVVKAIVLIGAAILARALIFGG